MRLEDALDLREREVIAFVGAGGKTTAMFRLAHELQESGRPAVVTTTTKIFAPEPQPAHELIVESERGRLVAATAAAIARGNTAIVGTSIAPDRKLIGLDGEWVADLHGLDAVSHVLVEADGARRLPITAPREGEPVIPSSATLVVALVGADALGERVAQIAHRPEHVARLTGLRPDDRLDPTAIARVVLGPDGNTRGRPADSRVIAIVNKVDDTRMTAARAIAAALGRHHVTAVALAALGTDAGVVELISIDHTAANARNVRRETR
jgi:probable selenium-dependent hydroxylase accessory protein YqeC